MHLGCVSLLRQKSSLNLHHVVTTTLVHWSTEIAQISPSDNSFVSIYYIGWCVSVVTTLFMDFPELAFHYLPNRRRRTHVSCRTTRAQCPILGAVHRPSSPWISARIRLLKYATNRCDMSCPCVVCVVSACIYDNAAPVEHNCWQDSIIRSQLIEPHE